MSGAALDDVAVRGGLHPEADAREPVERGCPRPPPVPPEHEPVRVSLDVRPGQAVMDAHGPSFQVRERPVGPRQDRVRLALTEHGGRVRVPGQVAVPASAVGDDLCPGLHDGAGDARSEPAPYSSVSFSRMRRAFLSPESATAPARRILPAALRPFPDLPSP